MWPNLRRVGQLLRRALETVIDERPDVLAAVRGLRSGSAAEAEEASCLPSDAVADPPAERHGRASKWDVTPLWFDDCGNTISTQSRAWSEKTVMARRPLAAGYPSPAGLALRVRDLRWISLPLKRWRPLLPMGMDEQANGM